MSFPAAMGMPGGAPPVAPVAPQGGASAPLTPEQQEIVQIVINDPVLLQAILEALTGAPGGGVGQSTEMRAIMKGLAEQSAPIGDESQQVEKRILGSAKRGK